MSTQYFSGIRITLDGSTPTSVAESTMSWTTSSFFRFKYTLDDPADGDFSSITVALDSPSKLLSVNVSTASDPSERVDLDLAASIGRFTWGDGFATTVMIVQTGPNEASMFALAGDALPVFSNVADYIDFMEDAVTGLTSDLPTGLSQFGHSTLQNMTRALSYTATSEHDYLVGLDGVDLWWEQPLETGVGNDTVYGTSGGDWVRGGDNADYLAGMDGDDRLYGEIGNDHLYGALGNDSLYGGNGNDSLWGFDGNDSLSGGKGADTIQGENGADRLNGESGNDLLFGGLDNDSLYGGSGDDTLVGEDGNDLMRGERGLDSMYGGEGDDDMDGGTLEDLMYGGNGNDTLDGGSYNDTLYGEDGADSLNGASGNDLVYGGVGGDTIKGYTGDDWLFGEDGDDSIDGGSGNDHVDGGIGNDYLRGAAGNDTIMSGLGDDTMIGYTGADSFVIESMTGSDLITDFRGDYGDILYVHADLAADVETAMGFAVQDGASVVFDFGEAGTVTMAKTTLEHVELYLQIWSDDVPYL